MQGVCSNKCHCFLRWPGLPDIYLCITNNLTIFHRIFKSILVVILGRTGLAFDTDHFLKASNAVSKIIVKDIVIITTAAWYLLRDLIG